MRKVLKWLGGGALVLALLFGAMVIATRGDYEVAATVVDDAGLPSFEVLGVGLHGRVIGPEAGPVAIVLHGGPGGDHRSLLPLAALTQAGWRVVFYDQRGAGLSQRVAAEALTLEGHLDELDALAEMVSPQAPVALIGHSWGAMLASAYLGRHPDRVSRAVLIEPGFLSAAVSEAFLARMRSAVTGPAMIWHGLVTGFRAQHVDGPDAAAGDDFLFGAMAHAFADHPAIPYACPGEAWDSPSWRYGALAGRAVLAQATPADLDSLGAVEAFTGPVLLVSGGCDDWLGAALQETHLGLFADARHVEIAGAGHDVIDDRPAEALATIGAFLAP